MVVARYIEEHPFVEVDHGTGRKCWLLIDVHVEVTTFPIVWNLAFPNIKKVHSKFLVDIFSFFCCKGYAHMSGEFMYFSLVRQAKALSAL